jgi:hypothetical protein
MTEVPAATMVTVPTPPEFAIVAVPTVPDAYVNAPAKEFATVGAVNVKAESPIVFETFAKEESEGSPFATVNVWVA